MKIQEYSVSNRGLRPNLVGTPEQLRERIEAYEDAGLDLLLQMSPQAEEMERFAAQVMRRDTKVAGSPLVDGVEAFSAIRPARQGTFRRATPALAFGVV